MAVPSNPRPDTQCLGGTDGRRPAAEPITPASAVLPSRFAGRDSDALAHVGVCYALCPHLSTAIHKEKKKQKEKGPADEGSLSQSNNRTLLKNGKADISILLQQPLDCHSTSQAIRLNKRKRSNRRPSDATAGHKTGTSSVSQNHAGMAAAFDGLRSGPPCFSAGYWWPWRRPKP
jgi:hypothetical protein